MQEPEFKRNQVGSSDFDARANLPCIHATALGALERRLQEHRLPVAEEAFLAARLATYRRLAQLNLCDDCSCSARAA
jgi:hypothetical protein